MKSIGVVTVTAVLMVMTVAPAAAQDDGVYINPVAALLLLPFAVAATITVGAATVLTAPFAYPYAYPDPYPDTYDAAVSVYASPGATASSYWYYCASARTYYPYISTCPEGWMQVVPSGP